MITSAGVREGSGEATMFTRLFAGALLAIPLVVGDLRAQSRGHILPQNQALQSRGNSVRFPQTASGVANLLWTMLQPEAWRKEYELRRAPTDPANYYTVGDFKWIDIDHDGSPDLIATLSATPRLVYGMVIVARHVATTFDVERISVLNMERLTGAIRDLNGDGNVELIVRTEYASGSGQNLVPWSVVLGWSGDQFVDVSDRFPEVYEAQLSATQDEVLRLDARANLNPTPLNIEQLAGKQMILDRLLRVTSRDVDAPIRRAERWVTSANPVLREFAVRVFETFPGGAAVDRLRVLARDPERQVREHATLALEDIASRVRPR